MSVPNKIIFCICLLLVAFHCKQKNPLAQNEIALVNELVELDQIFEQSIKKDRPNKYLGIREKSRQADPNNPPIVLDIIAARSDVRDIKLTDLYTKVRYIPIRFKDPPDSLWVKYSKFEFLITPNNIIASNFSYGITQFDLYGNFMSQIVKNDFYYTAFPGRNAVMVSADDRQQFVGSKGDVHATGDIVYYQYHNNPENVGTMMKYDVTPGVLSPMMVNQTENFLQKPKGVQIFDIETKELRGAVDQLGADNIFPINEDEWASSYSKMSSSKTGAFMVSTNLDGDTISKFNDFDPIRNFTGSAYRSLDQNGSQYDFRGTQYIRQGHNDTIYTVVSSNQLIPKYVIDFGGKGIQSSLEYMDSRFDLKDKFVIDDLIETNKYLFIIYTQDYPCPNTAKKGSVFYNACIYNKQKGELFHVYTDEPPYVPEGRSWPQIPTDYLGNDIDYGPAFWPMKTASDGNPFMWIKGMDLKEHVDSNSWKNDTFSHENIFRIRDIDYLLMIAY